MKTIKEFYYNKLKPMWFQFVHGLKILYHMTRKNRRIHTILKYLTAAEKEGERNTKFGHEVTVLGRSRSNLEIHLDTNIRVDIVNELCFKLINMGYVKPNDVIKDDKIYRFNITAAGRVAVIDDIFLNKIWWRNWDLWKWLLPTLISLVGGILGTIAFFRA